MSKSLLRIEDACSTWNKEKESLEYVKDPI